MDIVITYMLAKMVFYNSGKDIMMINLTVRSVIFAPFLVAFSHFVHRSAICVGKSAPLVNLVDLNAFSAPISASSDILPYALVREF